MVVSFLQTLKGPHLRQQFFRLEWMQDVAIGPMGEIVEPGPR